MINGLALAVGSAALLVGAVLLVISALPGTQPFAFAPVAVLFVLVFPLHGWTVALGLGRFQRAGEPFLGRRRFRGSGRRGGIPLSFDSLPRGLMATGIVGVVACGISAASVFLGHDLPGQPSYNPVTQRYTADDHGTVIPLTKGGYDRAVKAQNRLFLSIIVVFTVVSVGVTSDELLRRRRSSYVQRIGPSP